MKKLMVCVASAVALCGCDWNYEVFDMDYKFDYAYIKLPNGTCIEGPVESWRDYEGEQLQVKIQGTNYLASSFNCVLIKKGK